ncbi:hypothetical protein V8D89_015499 [Ganoderma adspersum]
MCGRFALGLPHGEIQQMHGYNVQVGEWVGQDQFVPRYNIAPRSQAPVIRRRDDEGSSSSGSSSGQRRPYSWPERGDNAQEEAGDANVHCELAREHLGSKPESVFMQTMRWGLVPHWSKHEDGSLKTINARCEALIEGSGGMWASIKGKKRCAVVCQGYYEWLKKGKDRVPHFTKPLEDRLMLLAGLWDCVTLEGSSEPLWTFTIVTTDAGRGLSWLHDRQPVILPDEHTLSVWLDTSPGRWTPELSKLCAPYNSAEHQLTCYQVPKEVGKVGTESATFVQPVAKRKDGIAAMFSKQLQSKTSAVPQPKMEKRKGSPIDNLGQEVKKAKVEIFDVDAWQDDSEIHYNNHSAIKETREEPGTSTLKHGPVRQTAEQQPKISKMDRESAVVSVD